jgi:exodeoxyribonuclease V alpha subunit
MDATIVFTGTLERIIFAATDKPFTVAVFRVTTSNTLDLHKGQTVIAAGLMPPLTVGETVKIAGDWKTHPRFGLQIAAALCTRELPVSQEGLIEYLGSGLIEGVGKTLATRIVAYFGADTARVLNEDPERLTEVEGIGKAKGASIAAAWSERRTMNDAFTFLFSVGLHSGMAQRIWETYKEDTIATVQANPYQLVKDVELVGFKRADDIGHALSIPHDSPFRIQAGIFHALAEASQTEGHVYLPQVELEQRAVKLLSVTVELVRESLAVLLEKDSVVQDRVDGQDAIYRSWMFEVETTAARRVRQIVQRPRPTQPAIWTAVDLTPQQSVAVQNALSYPVSVITGGPGTGKTFVAKALVRLAESQGRKVALAAPTGRAAKRLSESTDREAFTLHRLLEYRPGDKPGRDADKPLECDLLVVDEASMIDITLFYYLVNALAPRTNVIFLGDVDQLPSVGPGTVLADMIEGKIPTTRLTQIMRQAEGSPIVRAAHAIRQGRMPELTKKGAFVFTEAGSEVIDQTILQLVRQALAQGVALDDVQVLSPMYRGSGGVNMLNTLLQNVLNPKRADRPEQPHGDRVFRVGDKVLQTRNNYDKGVVNGDLGIVVAVETNAKLVVVLFADDEIQYRVDELEQLTHAFAMSVHKSQGSEFRYVIIALLKAHFMLLQRNLVYTGITRARERCVLIGDSQAVGIAVHNNEVAKRWSALGIRLRQR